MKGLQMSIYDSKQKATLKQIRALLIGDVIECYYVDCNKPCLEVVIQACNSTKEGNLGDIKTIELECFNKRGDPSCLRTDKFKLIGRLSSQIL